jgi:hypothetical protein
LKKQSNDLRLVELEKRVDLALKGLNILLLGEAEDLPAKERKILQKRFRDYTTGKTSEFVELKELQNLTSQESD